MSDFSPETQVSEVFRACIQCGTCAVGLGLVLYFSLYDITRTMAWLESMALAAFIPVEATYEFLAALPLSIQVTSLCAWVWAVCVCKKLVKYGVTGPAYRKMIIAKNILFSVFLVIASAMLMKKGLFGPVYSGLLLIWFLVQLHKQEVRKKERGLAQ
jgi:hypothetical protein